MDSQQRKLKAYYLSHTVFEEGEVKVYKMFFKVKIVRGSSKNSKVMI
ncbi:hypothetical protein NDK43_30895 [Neobacillus pocheonensis]|uniref:Uncharacterized protein n=1 Tax=Neobacillus pocheonensis TaxID=363869 RepID=A0ABT0WHU1_9BACI|nr:hypothetical protein [Neobacillus pocheonensis]